MLERLMISKIRVELIKHFLQRRQERFYLRQLERLLHLSLTPLRKGLIHLTELGLLKEEEEANLKFYSLNPHFEQLPELARLIGNRESLTQERQEQTIEISPAKLKKNQHPLMKPTVIGLVLFLVSALVGILYFWKQSTMISKVQEEKQQRPVSMSSNQTGLEWGGFVTW